MREFGLIFKLLLAILFVGLCGDYLPDWVVRGSYTVSLIIKEILVFFLPLIIFIFLFSSLSAFKRHAPAVILMILALVIASNFFFTQFSFGAGHLFLPFLKAQIPTASMAAQSVLEPYFSFSIPKLISSDIALLIGVIAGMYNAFSRNETLTRIATVLKQYTQTALTKLFIPIVPLYILGFLFKVHYETSLITIFKEYGPIFMLIVGVQVGAILLSYWVANGGKIDRFWQTLKTASSSGLVGFSTMSSAATLPVTLEAAEKNTQNPTLSQMVITATTNIHHVGDSIAVPIVVSALFMIYGFDAMSLNQFLFFTLYYMVAKFGVASVPGGEAMILLPILQTHFGFTHEMSGLLTAIYMLLDPFITVANVMCNGAFAIGVNRFCGRMKAFQTSQEIA